MTTKKEIQGYIKTAKNYKVWNDRIMIVPINVKVKSLIGLEMRAETKNFPIGVVVKASTTSRLSKHADEKDNIAVGDIVSYYDRSAAQIKLNGISQMADMVPDSDVYCAIPHLFEPLDSRDENGDEVLVIESSGAIERSENDAAYHLMGMPSLNAKTDLDEYISDDDKSSEGTGLHL